MPDLSMETTCLGALRCAGVANLDLEFFASTLAGSVDRITQSNKVKILEFLYYLDMGSTLITASYCRKFVFIRSQSIL